VSDSSKWNDGSDSDTEISMADIVEFIQESWKHLLIAGIIGAALGFGGWYFLGSYKAELILLNNNNNTNTTNTTNTTTTIGLDLMTWRTLQKSLPSLANQIITQDNLAPERKDIYQTMSDSQWWAKSVIPSYLISKADTKDLAMISKDLDSSATKILSFTINTSGQIKESAVDNARLASQFFKSGGAYLQLKTLLNGYESETISTVAEIQSKLTQAQVDQKYYQERIKTLEDLLKRFPNRISINTQLNDSKESGSKYLPVENQLIAANNDLSQSKEVVSRLNDRLLQIKLMKQFLDQAIPLVENQTDGILLVTAFLTIEEKLRKDLAANDLRGRLALDQLRSQLLTIEARFVKGLEAGTTLIAKKTSMLKTTAAGIAIGGFLMLAFLLGRKIVRNLKPSTHRP
jgi:hypothetical protein